MLLLTAFSLAAIVGGPPHAAGMESDDTRLVAHARLDSSPGSPPEPQTTPPYQPEFMRRELRVYIVRPGDSLWKIARRFGMPSETLAEMNQLTANDILPVGRPLKVMVYAAREWMLDTRLPSMAQFDPPLGRLRLTDGRPVPRWMVKNLVVEVVGRRTPGPGILPGEPGANRLGAIVDFQLVKNHLAVRARKFQSIVMIYAERYGLDPALIMAMIHTESYFNPRARSNAPAYGLMQLVPHAAGREAYHTIYGQRRTLPPEYLYDPENNIELGTAYFDILKKRYLGSIVDPASRTYCAVAAYHAGPSSVGKAFVPQPSIKLAAPVINSLAPADVYARLVEAMPSRESRNYVRKVMIRVEKYKDWYGGTTPPKAPIWAPQADTAVATSNNLPKSLPADTLGSL